jgi:hypothetical protein
VEEGQVASHQERRQDHQHGMSPAGKRRDAHLGGYAELNAGLLAPEFTHDTERPAESGKGRIDRE